MKRTGLTAQTPRAKKLLRLAYKIPQASRPGVQQLSLCSYRSTCTETIGVIMNSTIWRDASESRRARPIKLNTRFWLTIECHKKSILFNFFSTHFLNHLHTINIACMNTFIVAVKRLWVHNGRRHASTINRRAHP